MLGKVIYLNPEKRFGRVRANGSWHEFYFARWDVAPELGFANLLGEFVDFDPQANERGPVAIRIRPVRWLRNTGGET